MESMLLASLAFNYCLVLIKSIVNVNSRSCIIIMKKYIMYTLFLCLIFLSACNSKSQEYQMNFTFTDQSGNEFSSDDLEGKVWLANFIFTNCDTVCPPMTAHMAKLQQMLADEGVEAEIVSFSVDPKTDTPEVLTEFASKFDADFSNWHFLTGYTQEEIESFAKEEFATLVSKPENQVQVMHGTSFYIIDQNGEVVDSYSGVEDTPYDEIVKKIKTL
ncbi:protein SCO1/2 [Litchfieldia salsa]|uniref:Protein SCO1/2 n=2 Tax=Litchfieldia salsa TaxID=930152 RepID=A0A1H0TGE9_9BACI|nr:protein SCO1/2 [Litchfieldia salsa]